MSSNARKCTTQQTRSKQSVIAKCKKPGSHSVHISALKTNNTQLATALDELRQDYRKLQRENLQLKQERQTLLERVASLEKRFRRNSFSELLQEAQSKLHEVQSSLEYVLKNSRGSTSGKLSLSPKKVLRFSSPSVGNSCTIYPRTPYPLHNLTCVVDGPQLASTPVKSRLSTTSPQAQFSPQIDYRDSVTATTWAGERDKVSREPEESGATDISVIRELVQGEKGDIMNPNSTLDQLENALTCERLSVSGMRPRRKCVSFSLSYQEPTLKCKLRRGDPFTEQVVDWSPPERRKKGTKKGNNTIQRKVLCDIKNQL